MTKLKKQVARLKINHLLNKNKYILFYPSNKILPLHSSFLKKERSESSTLGYATLKLKKEVPGALYVQKRNNPWPAHSMFESIGAKHQWYKQDSDECSLTNLFIKNKIAQKAILFSSLLQGFETFKCVNNVVKTKKDYSETEYGKNGAPYRLHNNTSKKCCKERRLVSCVSGSTVVNKTSFDTTTKPKPSLDIVCPAIFQGNISLLGCKNLNTLQKILKTYNQPIGGLYNTSILDHFQVQRLAACSQDKKSYEEVVSCIKMPSVNLLFSIKDGVSLFCLSVRQNQLLRLLLIRSNQLSCI